MAGALEGIKILDLTSVGFGPYACQILGDYGAEVIKIESPEGDITRGIAPFRNKGMGHFFINANLLLLNSSLLTSTWIHQDLVKIDCFQTELTLM